MITEQPDFDLSLVSDYFTADGDYTKDVVLAELEYWRSISDFLILISENDGIDGFLIGFKDRDSLWISQVWHRNGGLLLHGKEGFARARQWAIDRGLKNIRCETVRDEIKALKKYGFIEKSVNMQCEL